MSRRRAGQFRQIDDKTFMMATSAGEKMLFRAKGTVMECEELALLADGGADV